MGAHKIQKGAHAEQNACDFLSAQGLKLICRNYRCLLGEIDIIMRDSDDIVFIETRYRQYDNFGSAIESVNFKKQKKIIRTAEIFLQQYKLLHKVNCRFDIIGISPTELKWVKNAFSVDYS